MESSQPNWANISETICPELLIIQQSGEGLTSFNGNKPTNFCGKKKSRMMLSGESIFREQARKLGIEV